MTSKLKVRHQAARRKDLEGKMNAEELKELREVIGKAIGYDGPYRWGIEDYVAVAEHFKAKGLAEAESRVKAREQEIVEWLHSELYQKDDRARRWLLIHDEWYDTNGKSICTAETRWNLFERLEAWLRKE